MPNIQLWLQTTAPDARGLKDRMWSSTETKGVCKEETAVRRNDLGLAKKRLKQKRNAFQLCLGLVGDQGQDRHPAWERSQGNFEGWKWVNILPIF